MFDYAPLSDDDTLEVVQADVLKRFHEGEQDLTESGIENFELGVALVQIREFVGRRKWRQWIKANLGEQYDEVWAKKRMLASSNFCAVPSKI